MPFQPTLRSLQLVGEADDKSVPVRHLYLRQRLGVHRVVLADELVLRDIYVSASDLPNSTNFKSLPPTKRPSWRSKIRNSWFDRLTTTLRGSRMGRKRPRGPKQTGGQTNPKLEKIQNRESESSLFGILGFWSFEFVSDFVLRISCFLIFEHLDLFRISDFEFGI